MIESRVVRSTHTNWCGQILTPLRDRSHVFEHLSHPSPLPSQPLPSNAQSPLPSLAAPGKLPPSTFRPRPRPLGLPTPSPGLVADPFRCASSDQAPRG